MHYCIIAQAIAERTKRAVADARHGIQRALLDLQALIDALDHPSAGILDPPTMPGPEPTMLH